MVKLYVRLIKTGSMTLEDVPAKWREAVAEALENEYSIRHGQRHEHAVRSHSGNGDSRIVLGSMPYSSRSFEAAHRRL